MKHLTKQEAIGRMMLAQASLIEENFQCELMWNRSFKQCVLKNYAKKSGADPHLPFWTHSDFNYKPAPRGCFSC